MWFWLMKCNYQKRLLTYAFSVELTSTINAYAGIPRKTWPTTKRDFFRCDVTLLGLFTRKGLASIMTILASTMRWIIPYVVIQQFANDYDGKLRQNYFCGALLSLPTTLGFTALLLLFASALLYIYPYFRSGLFLLQFIQLLHLLLKMGQVKSDKWSQ